MTILNNMNNFKILKIGATLIIYLAFIAEPFSAEDGPVAPAMLGSEQEKSCKIRVGWSEWKPYQYMNEQNQLSGHQIEFLRLIAGEIKCQLIFTKYFWVDSVNAIKNGELDILGNASFNDSRSEYAYFSKAYREDLLVLYIRSEDKQRFHDKKLKKLYSEYQFKLGAVEGIIYEKEYLKVIGASEFRKFMLPFDSSKELMAALINKEIDGFFEDPFIFDALFEELENVPRLESFPIEIKTGPIHFMFSKKSVKKTFVDKFNKALTKVLEKQQQYFEPL